MTENKLPEGVGKKIVEALKKQSEIEITPIEQVSGEADMENLITDEVENMFEAENVSVEPQQEPEQVFRTQQAQVQEPVYQQQIYQHTYEPEMTYTAPQQPIYRETQPQMNYGYTDSYTDSVQTSYQTAKEFTIPANVAVLKRLIAQLPQGVSKPTGAQIIRQTMEALGISMATVLTEAQNFQDGLNTAVRDCVSNIQEYKNNIKNLEKQVSDYQKQSSQVNDLISLFIMTDK